MVNLRNQILTSTLLMSSGVVAVQIAQQAKLETQAQAQAQLELKMEMTQQLMNQALNHVLQTQNLDQAQLETELEKKSEDTINKGVHDFLREANLTQMILQKQDKVKININNQDQELVQTKSQIGQKVLSEVINGLIEAKCAVGKKCLFKDKKSLAKGANNSAKSKVLTKVSKSIHPKSKGKALPLNKSLVKVASKAKSVQTKSLKKIVAHQATQNVAAKPKPTASTKSLATKSVAQKTTQNILAQPKPTTPVKSQAKKSKTTVLKKPAVKKAIKSPKPKLKQHIQIETESISEEGTQIRVQGDPFKQNWSKTMEGVANPIDEMVKKNEEKIVKMGNKHMEGENGSAVGNSAHKNFNLIFNSMKQGKDVVHHDLDSERKELGQNLKQMGSMTTRAADVTKGQFKKGDQNSVQLEQQEMEVPAEGQEQPLSATEQVVATQEQATEAPESEQAVSDEKVAASIAPISKEENQNLLKKIDIDGMFKKFSKNKTPAKKTAIKAKGKTDLKAFKKKIATKVNKDQEKITKKKQEAKELIEASQQEPEQEATVTIAEEQAPSEEAVATVTEQTPSAEAATNLSQEQPVDSNEQVQVVEQNQQIQAPVEEVKPKKEAPKKLTQAKKKIILKKVPTLAKMAKSAAALKSEVAEAPPVVQQEAAPQVEPVIDSVAQTCSLSTEEEQLKTQGQSVEIQTQDENQQNSGKIEFDLIPKNLRDSVIGKEVQVLNSEKMIGYNAVNAISTSDKMDAMLQDSDYYNVTINLVVKRDSEFSVKQRTKTAVQVAQQEAPADGSPSQDAAVQTEQSQQEGTSITEAQESKDQKQNAQIQLEMAASISSPQEEKQELAEAEKYTSKIANNYANEEMKKTKKAEVVKAPAKVEQEEQAKEAAPPADQVNTQLGSEQDMAIQAAEVISNEQGQAEQEHVPQTEEKDMAVMAFDAAASIGQYTGDMPKENPDDQFAQKEGLTTDQAIELAEKRNEAAQKRSSIDEQNVQLTAQVSRYYHKQDVEVDADAEIGTEYVDYVVPSDSAMLIENAFDQEEHQQETTTPAPQKDAKAQEHHDNFVKRVRKKEQEVINKQSNKVKMHPQIPANLVEQLQEAAAVQEESDVRQKSTTSHKQRKQISADDFDGEGAPHQEPEQQPKPVDQTAKSSKKDQVSLEVTQDNIPEEAEEKSERQKQLDAKAKLELQAKERAQKFKKELKDDLKQKQVDLENHIQKELIELAEIVNKRYGDEEHKFDYQLVRITDERPLPKWQAPLKDADEVDEQIEALKVVKVIKSEEDLENEIEEEAKDAKKKKEKERKKANKKAKAQRKAEEEDDKDDDEEEEEKSKLSEMKDKQMKKEKSKKSKQDKSTDLDVKDLFQKSFEKVGLSQQQQELIASEKKQNQIDKKLRKEFKKFEQQAIMSAHNEVNTDNSALKAESEENQKIQAEVEAAQELKEKATSEAKAEEKARTELKEQAELLAQADLKAKEKIREAAEMAAEAQQQNAIDFHKKLQDEANSWMNKNQELIKQQEAARKAQKEANEAIEAEKKEREILAKEKAEREAIEQAEKQKAEAKVQIVSQIASRTSKKAKLVQQSLVQKKSKKSKDTSAVQEEEDGEGDAEIAENNDASNENDKEVIEKESKSEIEKSKGKKAKSKKEEINDIVERAQKLKHEDLPKMPEQEEPEYAVEGKDKEQPYEKAIKPEPVAAAAPKKHHHHHKTSKPAVSEETEEVAAPVAKATYEEQPLTPLQKTASDPKFAQKAKMSYQKKEAEAHEEEEDEAIKDQAEADSTTTSDKPADNNDDSEAQQTQSDIRLGSEEALAAKEKEALQTIAKAQDAGEAKGRQAAINLINQQKNQTPQQNAAQVAELRKKLASTSQQVNAIINNFQAVHAEMAELKQEYVQSIEESHQNEESGEDSEVQLSGKLVHSEQSKESSHLDHLNQLLNSQKKLSLTSKEGLKSKIQQVIKKK